MRQPKCIFKTWRLRADLFRARRYEIDDRGLSLTLNTLLALDSEDADFVKICAIC